MVRKVQAQRGHGDVALIEGAAIRALLGRLDRHDRVPVELAAHRILAGNHLAVVVPHRLAGPARAARCFGREIHVDERQIRNVEEHREDALRPGLQHLEIGLVAVGRGRAERDPAQAEERGLLRCRKRSRVPDGIAEVQADIDSGEYDIHLLPQRGTQHDAIAGRAVDAVRLQPGRGQLGALVAQRPRRGDRGACRRHLDVGRHDSHLPESGSYLRQSGYARAIDAVVVRDEDAHDAYREQLACA